MNESLIYYDTGCVSAPTGEYAVLTPAGVPSAGVPSDSAGVPTDSAGVPSDSAGVPSDPTLPAHATTANGYGCCGQLVAEEQHDHLRLHGLGRTDAWHGRIR